MGSVSVSINSKGDITCPDTTARVGEQLTWSVTGGTISSITPGDPSPFTGTPTLSNGEWSATVARAGSYTIVDTAGKQKTPRISIFTEEPKAMKS